MADLLQPSPLFIFIIFFKTTIYIPLCASLGLLMCIFSEGRPRLAAVMATSLCLIVIITTNPVLSPIKSMDFIFFFETLSNLAHGWFLPFFISFFFFMRTVLYKFTNLLLETFHLIIFSLALLFLFLTM